MIPLLNKSALRSTPQLISRPIRKYSTVERVNEFMEDHPVYFHVTGWLGASLGSLLAWNNIYKFYDHGNTKYSAMKLSFITPLNLLLVPLGYYLGGIIAPCAAAGIASDYLLRKLDENKKR